MDLEKIGKHLKVEESYEEKVEPIPKATKPARIKEMTYTVRVTPKGTYSPTEYSQTIEILDADSAQIKGIRNALKKDVISGALEASEETIAEMHKKGML